MSLWPDFSRRADLPEWMDDDAVDFAVFDGCLKGLARVNALTLAHRPTLAFLHDLGCRGLWPEDRPLSVLDVGAGGGDGLRAIDRWTTRRGLKVKLTGLDRNPWAARSAAAASPGRPIEWITCDVFDFEGEADVIVSSLFTHHLDEASLVRFLAFMDARAGLAWLVNDLERDRLAYLGFSVLAAAMRWHPFVRHDGPISIRRAFKPADWRAYLDRAGVDGAQLRRWIPDRLCVSKRHDI